jgi:hypothetical protein
MIELGNVRDHRFLVRNGDHSRNADFPPDTAVARSLIRCKGIAVGPVCMHLENFLSKSSRSWSIRRASDFEIPLEFAVIVRRRYYKLMSRIGSSRRRWRLVRQDCGTILVVRKMMQQCAVLCWRTDSPTGQSRLVRLVWRSVSATTAASVDKMLS